MLRVSTGVAKDSGDARRFKISGIDILVGTGVNGAERPTRASAPLLPESLGTTVSTCTPYLLANRNDLLTIAVFICGVIGCGRYG